MTRKSNTSKDPSVERKKFQAEESLADVETLEDESGQIKRGVVLGRKRVRRKKGILGLILENQMSARGPFVRRRERGHLMTFSPERTRVAKKLMLSNLLSYPAGVVATDELGQLFWSSAPWRSRKSENGKGASGIRQRVQIFDPFALADPRKIEVKKFLDAPFLKAGPVFSPEKKEEKRAFLRREHRFYESSRVAYNPLARLSELEPYEAERRALRLASYFTSAISEKQKREGETYENKILRVAQLILGALFIAAASKKNRQFEKIPCASIPGVALYLRETPTKKIAGPLLENLLDEPKGSRIYETLKQIVPEEEGRRQGYMSKAAEVAREAVGETIREESVALSLGGTQEQESGQGQMKTIDLSRYFPRNRRTPSTTGIDPSGDGMTLYIATTSMNTYLSRGTMKMIVGEIIEEVRDSGHIKGGRTPRPSDQTLVLIENAADYGRIRGIETAMRPGRLRSGGRLWLFFRALSQAEAVYGAEMVKLMTSYASVLQATATLDDRTVEVFARLARECGFPEASDPAFIRRMEDGIMLSVEGDERARLLGSVPFNESGQMSSRKATRLR